MTNLGLRLLNFTNTTAVPTPLHSNFKSFLSLSLLPNRKKPFFSSRPFFSRSLSVVSVMDNTGEIPTKETPVEVDASILEDYASVSKLLQEFSDIPTIDNAWTFKTEGEGVSRAMFLIGQPNILSNKRRKSMLSSHIFRTSKNSVMFHWAPFPVEMNGVSALVPSPSGSKLVVVRNPEGDSPTHVEIWGPSRVKKEFVIPRSIHGSVYTDGWFEGISWNSDENLIAYVAEQPEPAKPTFTGFGYKKEGSTDKDCGSWKGQGVGRELSVGQVVWAPPIGGERSNAAAEDSLLTNLTQSISSAFFPRFSPVDTPEIKYGSPVGKISEDAKWNWLDVSCPTTKCSEAVSSSLESLEFDIMKIPVRDVSENLTKGASKPIEAIYVSSKPNTGKSKPDPLVDVNDVLTAIDCIIDKGLADPSKIAVLGGSHGGFLTTHLIGQVKTPTLFLLGAQDLRVPISTGIQSDFESFLNIGIWFKKYCR
ncbi:hypothetical protein PHJA_000751500 [Phtheirospermum japonicum]|uniref:acylaminoacyl-peptidase n=1 Tax=Phtheirospermum japonicum TaxID=374723 RepID=A0A830BGQ6_9LAMI|nr:hypothetical protein PHJA_000751500 [Phtheirospermum japonicum]